MCIISTYIHVTIVLFLTPADSAYAIFCHEIPLKGRNRLSTGGLGRGPVILNQFVTRLKLIYCSTSK